MAGSQKKVVVRLFSSGPVPGYLPAASFVHDARITLLDPAGHTHTLPLDDIKTITFVRDFNLADAVDPERIGRRSFLGRPRGEGLWVRLTFTDADTLEGLSDTGLALLDAAAHDAGLFLTPPEARSNAQRIYVPRPAIRSLEIIAVVTTTARPKPAARTAADPQPRLFE
jgi:hypothetical protein